MYGDELAVVDRFRDVASSSSKKLAIAVVAARQYAERRSQILTATPVSVSRLNGEPGAGACADGRTLASRRNWLRVEIRGVTANGCNVSSAQLLPDRGLWAVFRRETQANPAEALK
jgi:hypothetical protein